MATTTTTSVDTGGEDRVLATAQRIVKSLNTPKEDRDDMLLIFSSFDNRLSNIGDLINGDFTVLESAEKIIFRDESSSSWENSPDDVAEFLCAVDEILQLIDDLSIQSDNNDKEIMDRAETAIQVAMSRLEDEFRHLLTTSKIPLDADRLYGSIRRGSQSFEANEGEIDEESKSFEEISDESVKFHDRGVSLGDDVCINLINPDALIELKEISDRMIRSGYERECVQVYSSVRRCALDECLTILGVERLSIEEVQRIEWSCLDEKMKRWTQAVKITVRHLLSGEKRLCDHIFSETETMKDVCFNETVKGCVTQLLIFAEAVAIGKRSSEKLFRILDMYDALAVVLPDLEAMVTDDILCSEVRCVLHGLGEAAKGTFAEFENDVQSETSKKPMLGGEIHPLTRYVMNYVRLIVDYSETLNKLLENDEIDTSSLRDADSLESIPPVAQRLLLLLTSLESNIEEKSRLYDDSAIQYIFLMNNILYIVQKVKDSELGKLLGDNWVRRRRGQVRRYATSYLRASWSKALACLKDEGIGGGSSNASKLALKERFKSFNLCFEDIYRVQTALRVSDPQLRDELQISISENVIPAYRSFLGRFGFKLESGRNAGKYIKYTPEDLESYLSDLFKGSPGVLHHLRRKTSG